MLDSKYSHRVSNHHQRRIVAAQHIWKFAYPLIPISFHPKLLDFDHSIDLKLEINCLYKKKEMNDSVTSDLNRTTDELGILEQRFVMHK